MMRRSPMPSKRATPRRKAGRITHGRIKDKAGAAPTAVEQRHLSRVAIGNCIACGCAETVLHHVMKCAGKTKRRDHRFVARLCAQCHNMGDKSVHLLGSEQRFREVWGIDLAAWAIARWNETLKLEEE